MNYDKCLVLGGSGFLGLHLCEALAKTNQPVRAFSRNLAVSSDLPNQIEWLNGDFLNENDLHQAIQGCDIIYHLISSTVPATSNLDPTKDIQTNVCGTLKLLEIAKAEGVRKIVFVSSGGTVYGIPQSSLIPEDAPTNPICSYGITKLAIEKYLQMYHYLYGLDYCILRVANLFGERQSSAKGQGAVGTFMMKALQGEPVEIWGDGEVVRDYIYVHDVTDALIKAANHSGEQRIFNVGSGCGQSLNEVLASLETVFNRPIKRIYKPGRAVDVPVNVLDISLVKQHLQWSPKTDWIEALVKTYNWMKKQKL